MAAAEEPKPLVAVALPPEEKKDDAYFLEVNPEEEERLNLSQAIIRDHLEDKLVQCPLDVTRKGLRILDSATANGAWLVDLASLLPVESENTYIGTDITVAYFPRPAPNGIHLQEQSITKPWPADWAGMFDLVHQRMALPAAGKDAVKETIANMIALLKPGGWIQFVESDHSIAKGPAMTDMYKLISDLFNMMGTGADYGPQLEAWFAELGLVNVGARVLDVPLGKDNPKEEMKAMSTRCFCLANKGTVKVGKTIPTQLSDEELDTLVPRIEKELTEEGGVHRLYCVWGQKPE